MNATEMQIHGLCQIISKSINKVLQSYKAETKKPLLVFDLLVWPWGNRPESSSRHIVWWWWTHVPNDFKIHQLNDKVMELKWKCGRTDRLMDSAIAIYMPPFGVIKVTRIQDKSCHKTACLKRLHKKPEPTTNADRDDNARAIAIVPLFFE